MKTFPGVLTKLRREYENRRRIAMENAVPELKAVASEIGCRHTEHIAKYILGKHFT